MFGLLSAVPWSLHAADLRVQRAPMAGDHAFHHGGRTKEGKKKKKRSRERSSRGPARR